MAKESTPRLSEAETEGGKREETKKHFRKEREKLSGDIFVGKWYELSGEIAAPSAKGLEQMNIGDRIRVIGTKSDAEGRYRAQWKFLNTLTGKWAVKEVKVLLPLPVGEIEKAKPERKQNLKEKIEEEVKKTAGKYADALTEAEKDPAKKDKPYEVLAEFMTNISPEQGMENLEFRSGVRAAYPVSTPELIRRIKKEAKKLRAKKESLEKIEDRPTVKRKPERRERIAEVQPGEPTIDERKPEVRLPSEKKPEEPPPAAKPTIHLRGEENLQKMADAAAGKPSGEISETLREMDRKKLADQLERFKNTLHHDQENALQHFHKFEQTTAQYAILQQDENGVEELLTTAMVGYFEQDSQMDQLIDTARGLVPMKPGFGEINTALREITLFAKSRFKLYLEDQKSLIPLGIRHTALKNAWRKYVIEKTLKW